MSKRFYPEGTLVYHYQDGHCPLYVVVSEHEAKFDLALPWLPTEPVVRGVEAEQIEPVFEEELAEVS